MNHQSAVPISANTSSSILVCDTPEELGAIRNRACAAVLWWRQPAVGFQRWIDGLDPALLPDARIILRPSDVHRAVTEICEIHKTPESSERALLIDDIAALSHAFATVMKASHLRLRLSPVSGNACRKFHIDALTARLICTYRGTGTQYGLSADTEAPSRVFTVPTGAPFVLRGTDWPERPASGLLHRSPPIEGTGETRLVLVLDPIHDPQEAI